MKKNDNGKLIYLFVGIIGVLFIVFQLKTKLYAAEFDSTIITSSQAETLTDAEIINALVSDSDNVPDAEIIDCDYIGADGVYYANEVGSSYDDSTLIELLTDMYNLIGYIANNVDSFGDDFNDFLSAYDVFINGSEGSSFPFPLYSFNYYVHFDDNSLLLISCDELQHFFSNDDTLSINGDFYTYALGPSGKFDVVDLSRFYEFDSDFPSFTYIVFPFEFTTVEIAPNSDLNTPSSIGVVSLIPYVLIIAQCLIVLVCLFAFVEIYRTSKMIRKNFIGGNNNA